MTAAQPVSVPWALACRNLALIALAISTGRRCGGLMALHLTDLDLERCELRIAAEKSRTGRVLPVAAWAVAACARYIRDARPVLLGQRRSDALWVTQHIGCMMKRAYAYILDDLVAATVTANPDLTELPSKRISTHGLRVSFAALLFANGCGIRALNELLLHSSLDTTARYTPISRDELRAALITVHPRTAVACVSLRCENA